MTYLLFHGNLWALVVGLLVVLVIAVEVPFQLLKRHRFESQHADSFNAVATGLLTLTSFVVGLSFAQASARFDNRRALVVKEANAIGTTWLRAGQLPKVDAAEFRELLTDYTAVRLKAYGTPNDPALTNESLKQSDAYQNRLWMIVAKALQKSPANLAYGLLMQTLNDTIDVSAEQYQALTTHVPTAIMVLTLLLVVLSAIVLGLRFSVSGARPPVMTAVFAIAYVLVINMMIDYDRPQTGFVKINLSPLQTQLRTMQEQR
jgi:hypothetical protein